MIAGKKLSGKKQKRQSRLVVSFAGHGRSQVQSFPRRRESSRSAARFQWLAQWIPAFAGITSVSKGFLFPMTPAPHGSVKVHDVPRRGTRSLAVGETYGQRAARNSTPQASNIPLPPFPRVSPVAWSFYILKAHHRESLPSPPWGRGWTATAAFIRRGGPGEGVKKPARSPWQVNQRPPVVTTRCSAPSRQTTQALPARFRWRSAPVGVWRSSRARSIRAAVRPSRLRKNSNVLSF